MSAFVAGLDEAGRGPLAGPVYAAAVLLDPNRPIDGLRDSKSLPSPGGMRCAKRSWRRPWVLLWRVPVLRKLII